MTLCKKHKPKMMVETCPQCLLAIVDENNALKKRAESAESDWQKAETDIEKIRKDIQTALEFKQDIIISLSWLIEDAKHRFDDCRNNLEEGSSGGYSPELTKAIDVLDKLEGKE